MKQLFAAFTALLILLCSTSCNTNSTTQYTDYYFDYFDTATKIVGYAEVEEEFNSVCAEIKELLSEYHQLYNIYNRYNGIANLCTVNDLHDGVHKAVKVDRKIIDLLEYAKELYILTNGKMNIAMGSVLSIWHDYRTDGINDPAGASLPPVDRLTEAAEHTDINKIIIDKEASTVFLADPQMKLDVGAIAKGYAAEQIALYLEAKGINGYMLNIGGNIRCVGESPNGKAWDVGIENPNRENKDVPYIDYVHLDASSLVTSGNYQRYYTVNGAKYHHIIDPETLMPAAYFNSVSVLCKDSGKADALSTALFSMSYEDGKKLIESIADAEAMWVTPDGEQKYSSGFEKHTFDYDY